MKAKRRDAQVRRRERQIAVARLKARRRRPYEAEPDWARRSASPAAAQPDPEPAAVKATHPDPDAPRFDPDRLWRVLQVKPGWMSETLTALKRAQVETFRPMRTEVHVGARGLRRKRQVAILRGSVFVGVESEHHLRWVCALWTVDDERPLMTVNGRIVEIPAAQLDEFAKHVDEPGLAESDELAVGDAVLIMDGPFASFSGTVEGVLPNRTYRVAMAIFGRTTPADFEHGQLRRAA